MAADNPRPTGDDAQDKTVGMVARKIAEAERRYRPWVGMWDEAYKYAMPARTGFHDNQDKGGYRFDDVFDDTAITSLPELASRLEAGMTPSGANWLKIQLMTAAGRGAGGRRLTKDLDAAVATVFDYIEGSNFAQAVHEANMDLAVGTSHLLVEDGRGDKVLDFRAVPLTECKLIPGPDGTVGGHVRTRAAVRIDEIRHLWPHATIPPDLAARAETAARGGSDETVKLHDVTLRDNSRNTVYRWTRYVLLEAATDSKTILHQEPLSGLGANPWITARWTVAAGELYGRGPLLNALPNIKTANLVVQLTLENADMATSGMWNLESDGVINPDTIQILPGAIIPHARGSAGLQPVNPPGNPDLNNLLLEQLRAGIRKALYDELLGPPEGTPMSAREASIRQAELYRSIGSPISRMFHEFVVPTFWRVVYLLERAGRITFPRFKPTDAILRPLSPLALLKNEEAISSVTQSMQEIGGMMGPQALMMTFDPLKVAGFIAEKRNVPTDLLRTPEEVQQIAQQLQQAAQQQNGQPS